MNARSTRKLSSAASLAVLLTALLTTLGPADARNRGGYHPPAQCHRW